MDRTEGDERIATYSNYLSSDVLIGAVGGLRKHLKMMAGTGETIDGEEFIGYLLMGDEGNDKLLDQWLPLLATKGYMLHQMLLNSSGLSNEVQGQQLQSLLRPGTAIQINLSTFDIGKATIPWGFLYERKVYYEPGETYVCKEFAQRKPDCSDQKGNLCPAANNPKVVCPNSFWGYRYSVEQPPCWVGNKSSEVPSLVRKIDNTLPLYLNWNVCREFATLDKHKEELEELGQQNVRLLIADIRSQMEEIWEEHGSKLDLVYFYCHGDVDDSNEPFLQLGNKKREDPNVAINKKQVVRSHLIRRYESVWRHRPIVYLNGCATGVSDPDRYINLIEDFRAAGASGIIATECLVSERLAAAYAIRLIRRFFEGETLGKAMLNVRRELLKELKNPLGLIYSFYAAHEISLAQAITPLLLPEQRTMEPDSYYF